MRRLLAAIALIAAACTASAADLPKHEASVQLWRLACGSMKGVPLNYFSDTYAYGSDSSTVDLTVSCYLIKHDNIYLLWDTGLARSLIGHPQTTGTLVQSLEASLVDQLARIGVKPGQVALIGVSHNHFDHISQSADFPQATLLIGAPDFAVLQALPADYKPTQIGDLEPQRLAPWLSGRQKLETVSYDKDVFGDGTVIILHLPGHTDGHKGLLVRLQHTGAVLISGDLYNLARQREHQLIPMSNANRAQTLASFDRFEAIAKNLHAKVIIEHEPDDVAKLAAYPKYSD
jgi:glyoxylase-like metal-dependent hydrolase (beta-lactamase superfamily II)